MAKKRFFRKMKARARGFYKRSKSSGSTENLMMTIVAAGAYGAGRQYVEQAIQPISSKVPFLGNYTDEALLGTAGYLLARGKMPFFKGKLAKSVGKAVLIVEAARVGSGLMNKVPLSGASSQGNFDASQWG